MRSMMKRQPQTDLSHNPMNKNLILGPGLLGIGEMGHWGTGALGHNLQRSNAPMLQRSNAPTPQRSKFRHHRAEYFGFWLSDNAKAKSKDMGFRKERRR